MTLVILGGKPLKRALIETPRVYLDRVSKPIVYGIAALGLTLAIGIGVISYGGIGGGGYGSRAAARSRLFRRA